MSDSLYSIGGIRIRIQTDYLFSCPPHVYAFLSEGVDEDIKIKVLSNKQFRYNMNNKKYEDEGWFSVCENDAGDRLFAFIPDEICNITYLFIPRNGKEIEIFIEEDLISEKNISIIETTPFLMCYMMILARHNGIILHSSGLSINEKGFIFCGKSGSGKTTISNLFIKSNYATLLTDEALILRKNGDSFIMYGSPWKGSGDNIYSNTSSTLNHIYFIFHGKQNRCDNINKREAISALVKQAFPFFWDKKLMLLSFSLITELTNAIPCNRLFFLPNDSIVDFFMKREILLKPLAHSVDLKMWYIIKKKYLDSDPCRSIEIRVLSNSMAPALMQGETIMIKSAIFNCPQIGSIILFFHHKDHATIHRIIAIVNHLGETYYRTKGDANSKKDYYLVPASEVIGVVVQNGRG